MSIKNYFSKILYPYMNSNTKITPHFSIEEFGQPARHGLKAIPYPKEYLPRLNQLCLELEIIREEFDRPITILSGYRSPEYNRKIGGARYSQHIQGNAADIIIEGYSAEEVHTCILLLHKSGKIHLGGLGRYPGFCHVDIRQGKLARWNGSRHS